jgi:O-antigen/teichoic acid export membrane protein
MKLRRALRYLSLRPFDQTTPDGRAQERERRVALTALTNAALRVLSGILAISTVPLTIGYLGAERFGLWTTVTSLLAMMAFLDFGIGHGLMTEVAAASGRQDKRLGGLVSSGFYLELLLAGGLLLVLVVTCLYGDFGNWFGLTSARARAEAPAVVFLVGTGFCITMGLSVVVRVQSGLQDGHIALLWHGLGVALTLVALVIASSLKAGLVPLVGALVAAPALALIGNFCWFFLHERWDLRPRWPRFEWKVARGLLGGGSSFVVISLAGALGNLSDSFVIARLGGVAAVPDLAVPAKLFQLLLLPATLLTAPLWPAYSEAHARGDAAWVVQTLRRSTLASLGVAVVGCCALVLCGSFVVRAWTHGTIDASLSVLLPLGAGACLTALATALGTFLNGIGKSRAYATCAFAMAVVSFGLKWLLFPHWGVAGVAWATVVGYGLFMAAPLLWLVRGETRRLVTRAR